MHKQISPRVHGYIDYLAIVAFALAPSIFNFRGFPAVFSYVIAASYLALVLCTAYPMGVVKMVPFTAHGAIEAVLAPVLLISPWLFRFANQVNARWFFVAFGVALGVVWLVTDYKAAERPRSGEGFRKKTYA